VIRTRQSSVVFTAAILAGVVAILYFARDLIPLALAITLALILSPPVAWLRRLHLPRVAATLLVMFVSVSIAGAVGLCDCEPTIERRGSRRGMRQGNLSRSASGRHRSRSALFAFLRMMKPTR
jgi:hypothetical protein